jgi:hypothetical protein
MYVAKTGLSQGMGVTERQAVEGTAQWHLENDKVPENDMYITIHEFDPELMWDEDDDFHPWDVEDWCEDSWEVKIPLETFKEIGRDRAKQESEWEKIKRRSQSELEIENNGWEYWVVGKETGTIVAQRDRIKKAKEARDECTDDWDDGEEYEVIQKGPDEEMKTTLSEVEG